METVELNRKDLEMCHTLLEYAVVGVAAHEMKGTKGAHHGNAYRGALERVRKVLGVQPLARRGRSGKKRGGMN